MKSYIGDAVMAEPLIDQLTEGRFGPVILTSGLVDQVLWGPNRTFIKPQPARTIREIIRLAAHLRRQQFDAVVLVNHSFRSALVARLAGIRTRVGYRTEGRACLLTHGLRWSPKEFQTASYLRLGEAIGLAVRADLPRLTLTELERQAGKSALTATVAVQPGARYEAKRLPFDVTADLIRALQAKGETVALFGGSDERPSADQILSQVSDVQDWVGKLTIRETLGRLSHLRLAVGADTGAMHLAAAVDCPTVTVFGPTESSKWGHQYAPHRIVVAPNRQIQRVTAELVWPEIEGVLASRSGRSD